MSCRWNSIVVPYDTRRKIAAKKLYSKRGNPITILSGKVLIKTVIVEVKQPISKPVILVSNLLTHYDLEGSNIVYEFSPIHIFDLKDSNQTKLIELSDPVTIEFCEIDEMTFQLMTIDKKKINVKFSVHLYYKLN